MVFEENGRLADMARRAMITLQKYNGILGWSFLRLYWTQRGRGERKVRTPQSSVPDNVREGGFKPVRRKVPQRIYRPGFSGLVLTDRGKGEKVR